MRGVALIHERRFPLRRPRPVRAAVALFFMLVAAAHAVILFRTGDPTANTTAPTGALAGTGWELQGTFGNFLGTPIAPHFFITARHIGGAENFSFGGRAYTVLRSFDDPESDLAIWEVAETFPRHAILYTGSGEVGRHLVVFGRGTQRGPERVVDGALRGWEWSTGDLVQRWGENQVARITQARSGADLLYATFDQSGLPEEAHLSAGDSGGAVFVDDGGVWKLAGINYDVDSFASGPDGGGPYNAALFDERGSYTADGSLVTGNAPVPSGFYATRISSRIGWINSVIAPRLANISARAAVGVDDRVCIAGFIIAGESQERKRIIVRALGPSLQAGGAGIPGRLSNPMLELHDATGASIAANDDWRSSQASEITASGFAPGTDTEAAVLVTVAPGSYTAILRGANASSGIGLVEIYDLDRAGDSRLLNVSTRAFTKTDDGVLIGGVIAESLRGRLLLRVLGPELRAQGVDAALLNPKFECYDANGNLIVANDDWRSASNSSAIAATGLAPANDREAAILLEGPGTEPRTAIVRGAGSEAGVALLEAYLLE